MISYADTSFLVSLYTPDANSFRAARLMSTKPILLLTPFGELELLNAFELRAFRKELSRREVKRARSAFGSDRESGIFSLEPMPTLAYEAGAKISRRRTFQLGVRTLDILHVATALILKAETFYTFDERQRDLAKAEGLRTEG
ncbi:MAG: type II toxin-antitoxin system VapC family toxin [Terriglobia bacterium]